MKSDLLLSICIPTYNQPEKLERFLASMESQALPGVEVVIQDDSTNDVTRVLIERFSSRIPIRYFGRHCYFAQEGAGVEKLKKGERGGIDRSIIFLTQEARGGYVWWMGDDSLLPGAVEHVLSTLRAHPDIIFMWVNHRIADSGKLALDLGESHFFRDRNEIFEQVNNGLGFISATVFRREFALSGIEYGRGYIGTAFVNLYLALHVLSQGGRFFYLRGPYLVSYLNAPDEVNDNGFEVFGVHFNRIISEFGKSFGRTSVRRVLSHNFGAVWRGMLVRWVNGYESPKGKRLQILKLYWSYPECWIALPVMWLPLPVVKVFYRSYKVFFNERRWRWGGGKR